MLREGGIQFRVALVIPCREVVEDLASEIALVVYRLSESGGSSAGFFVALRMAVSVLSGLPEQPAKITAAATTPNSTVI